MDVYCEGLFVHRQILMQIYICIVTGYSRYGVYSLFPGAGSPAPGVGVGAALYSHTSTIGRFAPGQAATPGQSSATTFHTAHKGKTNATIYYQCRLVSLYPVYTCICVSTYVTNHTPHYTTQHTHMYLHYSTISSICLYSLFTVLFTCLLPCPRQFLSRFCCCFTVSFLPVHDPVPKTLLD